MYFLSLWGNVAYTADMLYGMSIIVYTCMTNLGRKSGSGMSFRNSQNTDNNTISIHYIL